MKKFYPDGIRQLNFQVGRINRWHGSSRWYAQHIKVVCVAHTTDSYEKSRLQVFWAIGLMDCPKLFIHSLSSDSFGIGHSIELIAGFLRIDMIKREFKITLCIIASILGVSFAFGMMRSKKENASTIPPYTPLIAPTQAVEPLSNGEIKILSVHFSKTIKLFKVTDDEGNEKIIPGHKTTPEHTDGNLLLEHCRNMAASSSRFDFQQILDKKYFTTGYIMTEEDYRQAKGACLKLLCIENNKYKSK